MKTDFLKSLVGSTVSYSAQRGATEEPQKKSFEEEAFVEMILTRALQFKSDWSRAYLYYLAERCTIPNLADLMHRIYNSDPLYRNVFVFYSEIQARGANAAYVGEQLNNISWGDNPEPVTNICFLLKFADKTGAYLEDVEQILKFSKLNIPMAERLSIFVGDL